MQRYIPLNKFVLKLILMLLAVYIFAMFGGHVFQQTIGTNLDMQMSKLPMISGYAPVLMAVVLLDR